jgi:hypothetical protein
VTARRQWVFRDPCGCPFGVMEAGRIDSEAVAFLEFYEDFAPMSEAIKRGVTAELMDHDRYERDVYPLMRSAYVCPHEAAKGGAA